MSRVFIIQQQKEIDPVTQRPKDKFDFSAAAKFGELVYLLGPGATALDVDACVTDLQDGLEDITADDWLLPTGSPLLIGIAFAIAADLLDGRLNMLQWSGSNRCYIPITVEKLYDEEKEFCRS